MLSAMLLAGCDGIARKLDPVALGFNKPGDGDERRFPLNLHAVIDGLQRDRIYLKAVFPEALLNLWTAAKKAEADYVYNAPSPQEYELYF
jgi:glutamine synthetase